MIKTGQGADLLALAGKLTEAQRVYLRAVAASDGPYEPRHGVTANWASRHKLTETVVRLNDGREGEWRGLNEDPFHAVGIDKILGQRLTPRGRALRDHLIRSRTHPGESQ